MRQISGRLMLPALHRGLAAAIAATCAFTLLTTSASAASDPADRKKTVDSQIKELKEDLAETGSSLAKAYEALKTTQAKLPAARTAYDQAMAASRTAAQTHALATQRLELARANEKRAEAELKRTGKEIGASRIQVARMASQVYQDSGFGEMDLVLGSTTPQQFADRLVLNESLMDAQSATIDRLATQKATQLALEDQLSALRAEAVDAEQAAKVALVEAQAAEASAAAAKATLDALAAEQQSHAKDVAGQLDSERKRLAALTKESKALAATLAEIARKRKAEAERKRREWEKKHGAGSQPPSTSNGPLLWPTAGGVSSPFGMRYHPILHYWRLHAGADIGGACGQPIYAAAAGTIVEARVTSGSGLRIVLDNGVIRGVALATTYNHLSKFAVTSGSVKRGQVIGYVGSTGLSTACHLHFETYENGVPVDPMRWL
jgi:murein DD-endopeptidase MepM/ murein hydrolase activator NlpD